MKCPKCDGTVLIHNAWIFFTWFVYCPTCGKNNRVDYCRTKSDAIKDWVGSNKEAGK